MASHRKILKSKKHGNFIKGLAQPKITGCKPELPPSIEDKDPFEVGECGWCGTSTTNKIAIDWFICKNCAEDF